MHKSPSISSASPSYAEILKKKSIDSSGSLDDSIEKYSKNVGIKYRKELREEEAERLKV